MCLCPQNKWEPGNGRRRGERLRHSGDRGRGMFTGQRHNKFRVSCHDAGKKMFDKIPLGEVVFLILL